jgi:DNA-directed RNA polymerase subunit RPC12/RpoP
MNKINEAQQSQIVQLYLTNDYSQSQLGDMYGVSYAAIHKILNKNGIPGRKSWAQTDYRVCSRCGRKLSISEFYRNKDYWCKECYSDYYHKNKNTDRLYAKYDMTEDDYLEMFEKQNGKCAICGKEVVDERLFVDHNHDTGEVRGLLCRNCNAGIGFLKDDIDLLRSAIKYLS